MPCEHSVSDEKIGRCNNDASNHYGETKSSWKKNRITLLKEITKDLLEKIHERHFVSMLFSYTGANNVG